jgi:hypothetical protein
MIYALLQQLQALGLNVPDMLKQLGTTDIDGNSVKVVTQEETTKPQKTPPTNKPG